MTPTNQEQIRLALPVDSWYMVLIAQLVLLHSVGVIVLAIIDPSGTTTVFGLLVVFLELCIFAVVLKWLALRNKVAIWGGTAVLMLAQTEQSGPEQSKNITRAALIPLERSRIGIPAATVPLVVALITSVVVVLRIGITDVSGPDGFSVMLLVSLVGLLFSAGLAIMENWYIRTSKRIRSLSSEQIISRYSMGHGMSRYILTDLEEQLEQPDGMQQRVGSLPLPLGLFLLQMVVWIILLAIFLHV
ncbi:MAG: hypothetical protein K9W43_02150 [Candidatus Thorarchaeota archaeon]|nr:hypothetical protein [Candidatus Thorarchaeota archaeon]